MVSLGLALALGGYAYAFYYFQSHGWLVRLVRRGLVRWSHPFYFAAAIAALYLALLSPIDALAHQFFVAHMVQHILLMMVAPLLVLLGLPSPVLRWLILKTRLRGVLTGLTHPLIAYAFFNVNLLFWHVPSFYNATLHNSLIHNVEHALFFYTGLFFFWRVVDPTHGWYPLWEWPPAKWIYLLVAAPPSYILGSILWATNSVLYAYYLYPPLPRRWGLSVLEDQSYGGLIMWLHGWMFVMASMIVFYQRYDPESERP